MSAPLLWVPITMIAAVGQVLRNGAQASLTGKIGTLGATQVRFIYGFPFAVIFLLTALAVTGETLPPLGVSAIGWTLLGAISQIGATALMLVVMAERAFGVAYAYIKTEPVSVALLGLILLGDHLSVVAWLAIAIVTSGVVLASARPTDLRKLFGEARPIATGVLGGALFGLSSIAFRAAILAIPEGSFVVRSLTVLVATLGTQTVLLGLWLAARDREAFLGSLREWRTSFGAGFLGAAASSGWFISFSLTAAANVRTLSLVEMPVAALISRKVSGRWLAPNEWVGLGLIMAGVAVLLTSLAA